MKRLTSKRKKIFCLDFVPYDRMVTKVAIVRYNHITYYKSLFWPYECQVQLLDHLYFGPQFIFIFNSCSSQLQLSHLSFQSCHVNPHSLIYTKVMSFSSIFHSFSSKTVQHRVFPKRWYLHIILQKHSPIFTFDYLNKCKDHTYRVSREVSSWDFKCQRDWISSNLGNVPIP